MISPLFHSKDSAFLRDLTRVKHETTRAYREVSSGLRLQVASDDPAQVQQVVETRSRLTQIVGVRAELARHQSDVDISERALQDATRLLDRAVRIGAEGATGTQTAEGRSLLANEVDSLLNQLGHLMNSSSGGRYLFAGDRDWQPAVVIDWQPNGPAVQFGTGSPPDPQVSTRLARHPGGGSFRVASTASNIAGGASGAFAALVDLRSALLTVPSGPEPLAAQRSAVLSAVGSLKGAQGQVSKELAHYGAFQQQIKDAAEFSAAIETELRTELHLLEEADIVDATLRMQRGQLQEQTAYEARSQFRSRSLFDFLG